MKRKTVSQLFGCFLGLILLLPLTARAQNTPQKSGDPELERVQAMIRQARQESEQFLGAGGKASKPFIPPIIKFEKKYELIKKYDEQKQKLISKIEKQSEVDLDKYILPHPLLGKVTLREMLYFTIHHNEHHLNLLIDRTK